MAFEKTVPEWGAAGSEPPASLKASGFQAGYKPPADYFNWFWHGTSEALKELQEKAGAGVLEVPVTGSLAGEMTTTVPWNDILQARVDGKQIVIKFNNGVMDFTLCQENDLSMTFFCIRPINNTTRLVLIKLAYTGEETPYIEGQQLTIGTDAESIGAVSVPTSCTDTDFNELKTTGFYFGYAGMTNAAFQEISVLEVITYSNDWVLQRQTRLTDGRMYYRTFSSGNTWSDWEVINTSKHPGYSYGTTDLTAGSSSLSSGTLYFVYE